MDDATTAWTAGGALARMRARAPLVQCITNYVAMTPAANALLALGASPAMVHAPEEVADFVPLCGALTINIGTLSAPWLDGMLRATAAARGAGVPWALDPVANGATPWRREAAARLMEQAPDLVRANASEILSLAGEAATGKGADAGDSVAAAEGAATRLARVSGAVVAVTGAVDFVTDGTRHCRIEGGAPVMTRVTAMGCALTAACGAFLATEEDAFAAATAALAVFGAAGAGAAKGAGGPGSFAPAFLDALAALTPEALDAAQLVGAA